jgi:hypothetical protein
MGRLTLGALMVVLKQLTACKVQDIGQQVEGVDIQTTFLIDNLWQ